MEKTLRKISLLVEQAGCHKAGVSTLTFGGRLERLANKSPFEILIKVASTLIDGGFKLTTGIVVGTENTCILIECNYLVILSSNTYSVIELSASTKRLNTFASPKGETAAQKKDYLNSDEFRAEFLQKRFCISINPAVNINTGLILPEEIPTYN